MIEQVTKPAIGELVSSEMPIVFKIPRYQREYTWNHWNWESLYDDLTENPNGYFLGSIIVIDGGHNAEAGVTECEVIDGQQRLTTISILLTAFYSKLAEHKADFVDDEEILTTYLNLKNRLVLKGKKGKTRIVPQVQNYNLSDYRSLLAENVGLESAEKRAKFAGNRKIYKAFKYFCERIDETVEREKEEHPEKDDVEIYCDLITKVISAVIVQISVSTHSDAYVLFESLNNRGTPLTAVDLIKNSLLANMGGEDEELLDLCFDQWQQILELLGNDYKNEERFFRQNYDAFRRGVNKPFVTGDAKYPLGAVATKSNLLNIYERQIKRDAEGLLDGLLANAEIYAKITLNSDEEMDEALHDALFDLGKAQGVPSYLLLLNLMKNRESYGLSDANLTDICLFLTSFFVRRNLTDTPPTRDLERLFIRICEELEDSGAKGDEAVKIVKDELRAVSVDDKTFEDRLRGSIYDINPDTTRFILAALAKPSVTKEMRGLWDKHQSGTYVWTIEHIFPQGKNIPDSWVDMIAGGNKEDASKLQDEYVSTIGNLTLTGYNSTLSNLSFADKRDRKDRNGNMVGYKNGFSINDDVADKEEWTISSIKDRTNRLVAKSLELFDLG